jgi:hypothetical protein
LTSVIRPPEASFYASVVLNVEKKEVVQNEDDDNDSDNENEIETSKSS